MNNNIKTLYIIGSGFDAHHQIKCMYSDFREWLHSNNPMLGNRLSQVYCLDNADFWSSFEMNLGAITVKSILEGYEYAPFIQCYNKSGNCFLALDTDTNT